jgi:thiol-disulfide isomerase/thioredoxin
VSLFGVRETRLPGFEGATGWLNSEPVTPDDLRGEVVLVDFWTYTCINWLRTLGYVRAWWEKYADQGLVVVGVHTPEFPFERDVENIREAVKDLRVEYPVAIDSDYRVWNAFANSYWPAVYIADAEGKIRHHQFGEGGYEECERVIQRLLRDAGRDGFGDDVVAVDLEGFEVQADWAHLESPETYLGYQQGRNFASPGGGDLDERRTYAVPDNLKRNQWALGGDWTIERGLSVLNGSEGAGGVPVPRPRRQSRHGPASEGKVRAVSCAGGRGASRRRPRARRRRKRKRVVVQQRLYQLVRRRNGVDDSTFEITFVGPRAEPYCFTFG